MGEKAVLMDGATRESFYNFLDAYKKFDADAARQGGTISELAGLIGVAIPAIVEAMHDDRDKASLAGVLLGFAKLGWARLQISREEEGVAPYADTQGGTADAPYSPLPTAVNSKAKLN